MFTCHLGPVCRGKAFWPHMLGTARHLHAAHLCLWKQARLQVSLQLCSASTRVMRSCPCCTVRAHVSANLGMGLFMLLSNGEQVSSAKKKRAAELVAIPAELVAIPAELGQTRSRNLLLADQSAAWSLIVVL